MTTEIAMPPQTTEYESLVDDLKAIITERVFNSRQELILGYGEVGQRIFNDPLYQKSGKGNREFLNGLFGEIGLQERTGYLCLQFYEKFIHGKYASVEGALAQFKEQKNLSWTKIVNKYLPEHKEKVDKKKELMKKIKQFIDDLFPTDRRKEFIKEIVSEWELWRK